MVFIEIDHGSLAGVSLELVCKGLELANQLGVQLEAVIAGNNLNRFSAEIFSYGCDRLYTIDDDRLTFYETLPYTKILHQVIRKIKPQIVLFGATPLGRDLAPRVASKLKTGLTADCTDLQISNHEDKRAKKIYRDILYQIRPAFGGNIIATIVSPEHFPQMATVREGVMKLTNPRKKFKGQVIPFKAKLHNTDFINTVLDRVISERRVNLKAADIIVAGGAGVGSRDNFQLIHDLAKLLGGAVGASRAAVDNSYIAPEHQVGQTGTTVRPKLYIAAGISGCIQHQAGMNQSGRIIAINTDPTAPIFQIAHYGIIGDLKEIIPMMINAYKHHN
ncbi:MAG: electron transfer flavoprotein subunit alpha/FixB family protein [Fidelibacterota bacterium]